MGVCADIRKPLQLHRGFGGTLLYPHCNILNRYFSLNGETDQIRLPKWGNADPRSGIPKRGCE